MPIYENVLNQIADLDRLTAEGARVRARVRWAEEGETSSAYFFRLERKRGTEGWISAMLSADGSILSSLDGICDSWVSFYDRLFSASSIDLSVQGELLANLTSFLPSAEASSCDGYLSSDEVFRALQGMATGKSPGSDGLPMEFYVAFWDVLGEDLVEVLNAPFDLGSLPLSQRSALITLIFKKGDRLLHKNWRPISLLNVDYKLCARALAGRLLKVIHLVVAPDQTCGVPGRFIGENVALLRDVAYLADDLDLPFALLSLDQEKAFDRVDWPFLLTLLSRMGFGSSFISWVKLLYTGIRSSVLINGYRSSWFYPSRGVRQGCPLSPLLYVLTMEVLAVSLRACPQIRGFNLPGSTIDLPVVSLYADDTTIISSSDVATVAAFEVYQRFERGTGAKLNMDKCEGLWLGAWRGRLDAPVPIQWKADKIKTLGVFVGHGDLSEANWRPRIEAVERCLSSWKARSLSFEGKALVLNALALSRVWYVASLVPMPVWVVRELNTLVFNFFWSGKRDLVARDVVIQPKAFGGFGVVSVELKAHALLAQWVRRFLASPNSWVDLLTFWCFCRFDKSPLEVFSRPVLCLPSRLPPFYAALLRAWLALHGSMSPTGLRVGVAERLLALSFTCKQCYDLLVSLAYRPPHCVEKFRPLYGDLDWETTWRSLFFLPLDKQVSALSWKVAHGVLYTADRLVSFGYNIPSPCFCGHALETPVHLFFSCPLAQSGISWIQSLLFVSSPLAPSICARHLLFGFSSDELVCVPRVFCYLLHVCKFFVWRQRNDFRFRSEPPSALRLVASLKSRLSFYLPLFSKRFLSARRRRFFVRQWGANGTLGHFSGGVFKVVF